MSRVVSVSSDELEARRVEILNRLGLSLDEFRDRAESSSLVGEEWDAWQALRDIGFLLGDE
jgi:hypothetical protein